MMDRDIYTIGWLCALPLEMAAAISMLDEEHPPIPQPATDQNTYALGRIGVHNIAVACLPSGTTGIGPAAAVATHINTTFPRLRFCLMVGVGGGAPTAENDIRLGDVVVSQPTATYPGVIQYDSGKMLQNGGFQRTGSLDRPPTVVLAAVANLRAKHMITQPALSSYIDALANFQSPGIEEDQLFNSEYVHEEQNRSDCATCDKEKLITRPKRTSKGPTVHYGQIASANVVMRDSATRDSLAKEYGILCFEMEAAGLMNTFPCLVVRGICDYSDSHKNKMWQPYAAATAAAYSKELLLVIPEAQPTPSAFAVEKKIRHNVPFNQNVNFLGRESQLSKLRSEILDEWSFRKVALYGLGGVGKTQIALQLAYQVLQDDPDIRVYWIIGTNISTLEQSFHEIADMLSLNSHADDKIDIKRVVKQHLIQKTCGRWLMVVDNADDIDAWFGVDNSEREVKALINFIPTNPSGSVIFTTRDRKAAIRMAGRNTIEIQELSKDSARDLFSTYITSKEAIDSSEKLDRLITSLCCLPLALSQAAAYINANFPPVNVSTYLSYVEGTEEEYLKILSKDFEDDARYGSANKPVATTWWISFEQIQKQDPLAATYLARMSCLAPDQIPEAVVVTLPPSIESNEALGILSAYSLISFQASSGDSRGDYGSLLDMHRLVHVCTRNWLKSKSLFGKYLLETGARLYEAFPSKGSTDWMSWSIFKPHAYKVISSSEEEKVSDERHELMHKLGYWLNYSGEYLEAGNMLHRALEIRQRILGSDNEHTLETMDTLTYTLNAQIKLKEAETLCLALLKKRINILGKKHPETLATEGRLASIYTDQGRVEEAEAMLLRTMQTQKSKFGEEDWGTLETAHNLALLYIERCQYEAAEELLTKSLKSFTQKLGSEHAWTLGIRGDLALVYQQLNRTEEAESLLLQLIPEEKRVLGDENAYTLQSRYLLATCYYATGRLMEAEALQASVVKARKKVLGEEHILTARSMFEYALCLWSMDRKQEALDLMKSTYGIYLKSFGQERRDTNRILHQLSKWQTQFAGGTSSQNSSTTTPVETQNRASRKFKWLLRFRKLV